MATRRYEVLESSPHPSRRGLGWIGGGIVAGLFAGSGMMLLAMLVALGMGNGFWLPPKLIGGLFLGVDALIGGAGAVVTGLVTHFVVSAIFGVVFAAIIGPRLSAAAALVGGVVYSAAIWLFMTWVMLPIFDPTMRVRVALIPGWWFVYHLVFGTLLFVTPSLVGRRAGIDVVEPV